MNARASPISRRNVVGIGLGERRVAVAVQRRARGRRRDLLARARDAPRRTRRPRRTCRARCARPRNARIRRVVASARGSAPRRGVVLDVEGERDRRRPSAPAISRRRRRGTRTCRAGTVRVGARSSSNDLNTTTSGDGRNRIGHRDPAHAYVRVPPAVDAHRRAVRPARGGDVRARAARAARAPGRGKTLHSTAAGTPSGPWSRVLTASASGPTCST